MEQDGSEKTTHSDAPSRGPSVGTIRLFEIYSQILETQVFSLCHSTDGTNPTGARADQALGRGFEPLLEHWSCGCFHPRTAALVTQWSEWGSYEHACSSFEGLGLLVDDSFTPFDCRDALQQVAVCPWRACRQPASFITLVVVGFAHTHDVGSLGCYRVTSMHQICREGLE